MKNKDDILETALNSGIERSAERHSATIDEVKLIVADFYNEMKHPCSCELTRMNGISCMCFICDAHHPQRNKIGQYFKTAIQ